MTKIAGNKSVFNTVLETILSIERDQNELLKERKMLHQHEKRFQHLYGGETGISKSGELEL